jgi:hypothetical protein
VVINNRLGSSGDDQGKAEADTGYVFRVIGFIRRTTLKTYEEGSEMELKDKDREEATDLFLHMIPGSRKPDVLQDVEVPRIKVTRFWERSIKLQFVYSLAGLFFGLVCIAFGILLFYLGITGNINWSTSVWGAESRIGNCAPGAILFIIGLLIVWITRFHVRIKN